MRERRRCRRWHRRPRLPRRTPRQRFSAIHYAQCFPRYSVLEAEFLSPNRLLSVTLILPSVVGRYASSGRRLTSLATMVSFLLRPLAGFARHLRWRTISDAPRRGAVTASFRLSCAAARAVYLSGCQGIGRGKGPGGSLDNGVRARDRRAGSGPKAPTRALFRWQSRTGIEGDAGDGRVWRGGWPRGHCDADL